MVCLGMARLYAQDPVPDEPVPDYPIHTLHVYMDLIQIPVLVLDSDLERMKPIDPSRFLVSLDSGPAFRPKHVRQEGDDSITLGIFLDMNGEPDLMPQMSSAISALAPGSLHAKDHVTLYALDCGLIRTLTDVPADPARLKLSLDHVVQRWVAHKKAKALCPSRVQLWDGMKYAVKELGDLPGRRVLLVVSSGSDGGSTMKWNELLKFAQVKGVAIFGYSSRRGRTSLGVNDASGRGQRGFTVDPATDTTEDPFGTICGSSGGMVMPADFGFAPRQLARFVTMVRERYILEFSRPRSDEPGDHNIQVTIAKSYPRTYIRPAGVSIMLPDASVANDPTTIPRDATDAPEYGNRKTLGPPH